MKLFLKIFFPCLIVISFPLFSQAADFQKEVTSLGGSFVLTNGYNVVPTKENEDMNYEYAIHHPSVKYEVRYALRPIPKDMIDRYKKWSKKKKKGEVVIDPNKMFESEFQAVMLNVAQSGTSKDPQYFNPQSVKAEFGADSGLSTYIENMTSQFAGEYKNCIMVGIHKNNIGQFYIFHLFDNYDDVKNLTGETFYSLKFNDLRK